MQDVENDMDDLFQRAAEDYPLMPGKDDWQLIYDRIKNGSDEPAPVLPLKKKRDAVVPVLATLLILSLASMIALHQYDKSNKETTKSSATTIQTNETERPAAIEATGKTNPANSNASKLLTGSPAKEDVITNAVDDVVYLPSKKDVTTIYSTGNSPFFNSRSTAYLYTEPVNPATENQDLVEKISPALIRYAQPLLYQTKVSRDNLPSAVSAFKKNSRPVANSRFYAGIVADVEFNKGKSMKFNNKGYNYGVVAGYQLSSRIALESGLVINKANYVSKGENFNMSKVDASMPAGMVINNLESNITLLEIPLKIKYDVLVKKNAVLFVTGGISSYIITKEKNNYDVSLNGQPQKVTGIYRDKSYEMPAAINLSAGYQKPLSSLLNIRIEPFLKIPIQGIGVGNLPVTCAGLQVVLTRKFK